MKKFRKKIFRKVVPVLDFGNSDGMGWIGKRKLKRNIIFRLFRSLIMHN